MPSGASRFEIDDAKPFDANLEAFCESLVADDPTLAEILKSELPKLLRGEIDRVAFWDSLHAATAENAS
jgi:hypothetical protein